MSANVFNRTLPGVPSNLRSSVSSLNSTLQPGPSWASSASNVINNLRQNNSLNEESFQSVSVRVSNIPVAVQDESPPPLPKRGRVEGTKNKRMVKYREFDTIAEYQEWFLSEKDKWKKTAYESTKTHTQSYHCKYYGSRTKGYNCPVKIKLLFDDFSEAVTVFISDNAHNHEVTGEVQAIKQAGLQEILLGYIRRNFTALDIQNEVQMCHPEFLVPNQVAIENMISRERAKATKHENLLRTYDLLQYAESNSAPPENPDKFYVATYNIIDDEKNYRWNWIITTPRLLDMLQSQKVIQTDATQSHLWGSARVHIFGFSDAEHHFYPCALGISTSECTENYREMLTALFPPDRAHPSYLLADGNGGITNASLGLFPNARRLMCWSHVYRNVKERLRKTTDLQEKEKFLSDICELKKSTSDNIFRAAGKLMVDSWRQKWPNSDALNGFIDYFQRTWLFSNLKYWYEGAAPCVVNNNGLETANRTLKNLAIFRRKLPFRTFVAALEGVIENWSRKPEYQGHYRTYKVTDSVLFAGYKLHNENRIIKQRGVHYFIPATGTVFNQRELSRWVAFFVTGIPDENEQIANLETWDQFIEERYKYHMVTLMNHLYQCSCPIGVVKQLCKHIVLIKYNKNELHFPAAFATRPLAMVSLRGRPPKTRQNRHALRMEE